MSKRITDEASAPTSRKPTPPLYLGETGKEHAAGAAGGIINGLAPFGFSRVATAGILPGEWKLADWATPTST
ncbi:MAG: hypothetical protein ABGY13_07640 [Verrucomicrobiia bacterium]